MQGWHGFDTAGLEPLPIPGLPAGKADPMQKGCPPMPGRFVCFTAGAEVRVRTLPANLTENQGEKHD